jgi:hypothetical protein
MALLNPTVVAKVIMLMAAPRVWISYHILLPQSRMVDWCSTTA